ncbi:MAG TPA: CDP-diacylglycerol--serine O-phosphatidyltransferase [Longimicrobiaceae bacterium]
MTAVSRRRLRGGVIVLPSAFTLGNLFLGIWAIVSAARGRFEMAGWLIVLAAFADLFDGRVARFTGTGSEFGEQLDSLVDAISFGVAPALIVHFAFFGDGTWNWILVFIFVSAAIIRLARFNVEQAGIAKAAFHGLPSPTAGVTLATYFAFTQTPFFRTWFPQVNVEQGAAWIMVIVAGLMISHVLYPVVPRFTYRTAGGKLALALAIASIVAALTAPEYFFFPMAVVYIGYGLLRTVVLGFLERLPDQDPLLDEAGDEGEVRDLDYGEIRRPPRFVRRRRPRFPKD